jgi:hypothetical protein
MASYSRLVFSFAAAAIAALLWTAAPAVAADGGAVPAAGKTAPVASSQHSRNDRRIGMIRHNLGCSGAWCGRQFVLMVGIAY